MIRLTILLLFATFAVHGYSQVVLFDDFDSYADDGQLYSIWPPASGDGQDILPVDHGILVPTANNPSRTPPNDNPPNIMGQAVNHLGGSINEYQGHELSLVPTEDESIRLSGDIFDDARGNKRLSIGLRNDLLSVNLIELGFWNANVFDPTVPTQDPDATIPSTGFAYRVVLFGSIGDGLARSPSWQYFDLPIGLDTNGDNLVTPADIGAGWHNYAATIGADKVTFELDLFRDGIVDASQTWKISPTTDGGEIAGFNSLRFGGPSGVSSANQAVFDNIKLELVDPNVIANPGDFNRNGTFDCDDVDPLVREIIAGTNNTAFDLNNDGGVDLPDLDEWRSVAAEENGFAAAYLSGDATLDGIVDASDLNRLGVNWLSSPNAWCGGDFNANGIVDASDLNSLAVVWQESTPRATAGGSQPVPEPATCIHFVSLLGGLIAGRRRFLAGCAVKGVAVIVKR